MPRTIHAKAVMGRTTCLLVGMAWVLMGVSVARAGDYVLNGYSVIDENGPASNRINIVFIGDGFSQAEIGSLWPQKVEEGMYYFRNVEPYKRYYKFFNHYRVNLVSAESGCDIPYLGIYKNTALDAYVNKYARFDMDYDKADLLIATALAGSGITPDVTPCPVYVDHPGANETTGYAMYAAGGTYPADVVIHETGHGWNRLGSEYGDNNPDIVSVYTGTESHFDTRVNVTTDPAGTKWAEWWGYIDPLYSNNGPIGAFEEAGSYDIGVYRPLNNCKMRTPTKPFCAVCREKILQDVYTKVRPLDGWLANDSALVDPPQLWVDVVDPAIIRVEWFIDGVKIQSLGSEHLDVPDLGLASGRYTITARAYDPTDWVRRRRELLEQSITWTIDVTTPSLAEWRQVSSPLSTALYAVWGSSATDIFAVGSAGTILHGDGLAWQTMSGATTSILYAAWGSGPNDVWASGASGAMVHWNGTTWTAVTSGTSNTLRGLWGSAANNVFAVGYNGTICRYNGTSWQPMTSGVTGHLYGVWGSGSDNVFVVGAGGTILRYNGLNWQPMTSGTTSSLYGVWGSGLGYVFAVGSSGTILRYDGTTWQPMTSGTTGHLYTIWGSAGTNVLASGYDGQIVRFDGFTWVATEGDGVGPVRGLWGSASRDAYAVGDGGLVLHYRPIYLGDINHDESVDVVDLLFLVDSWGLSPGEPGYDPACDVNGDGPVDVVDLLILVADWGKN